MKNVSDEFDAIVIGSGISGGWAAKELCESGLKTLVLERGRMVNHITDYPTANMDDWDFPNRGELTREEKAKTTTLDCTDHKITCRVAGYLVYFQPCRLALGIYLIVTAYRNANGALAPAVNKGKK